MDGIIVDSFDISSIEMVYEQLRGTIELEVMRGVVIAIAAILIIDRILREYKTGANENSGRPEMKSFTNMLYLYAFVFLIILLFPVLLSAVERTLGEMQQGFISNIGTPADYWKDAVKHLAEQKGIDPEGPSPITDFWAFIDYYVSVAINPIFYWFNKYLYSFFMVGRYFYLLMLEIVSPLAIVMLLNEKTHQYFMTWGKHMMICYLMIPFFLLANKFADTIINSIFTGEITIWFALLTSFLLKLSLFKVVNSRLYNLI